MGGSSVDMQGCVLSRSDCRYGLTLHAASAGAASGPHHTHTPPAIPAAGSSSSSGGGGSGGGGSSVSSSSPSSSPSLPSPSSAAANSASSHTGRMRLTDCELSHAIQLGGGEVELERCTFALRPTPADRAMPPVQNMSGPALGSNLLAIMAAMKNAVALSQGVLSSASGAGDAGAAFAGRVAATASLRVAGCRVGGGNGGSGEGQVVMEAAQEARVFVSGSPGVLIRRCGGASGVP
ncbi:hypothetical protein Vretifemale_15597 [Volvox reticuliferus]|nr:hypothetical protein Vretifemale_15597 [Volvox reticuliferus]